MQKYNRSRVTVFTIVTVLVHTSYSASTLLAMQSAVIARGILSGIHTWALLPVFIPDDKNEWRS